jgi:predicted RNase H-like HicB family nuclease
MRRNPAENWTILEVENPVPPASMRCEPPRCGGSHDQVAHPMMADKLTIPYNRPIKPVYIRKVGQFCCGGEGFVMGRLTCAVVIEPLPRDADGEFLARVPDLPGGSVGASPEEAVANVRDAIDAWIEAAHDVGHAIPAASRPIVLEAAQ